MTTGTKVKIVTSPVWQNAIAIITKVYDNGELQVKFIGHTGEPSPTGDTEIPSHAIGKTYCFSPNEVEVA
jgi:predicted KAP-like P-loop ATPase